MAIWTPSTRVLSNQPLELNRDNPLHYKYTLSGGKKFPSGTTAFLTIKNTYSQTLATFEGIVAGSTVTFLEAKAISNALPRGASWTLHIQTPELDEPRLELQGTVIRSEAPFPDAPPQSGEFDGVQYRYSFGTPGFVVDPAWRIMNGKPRVYDNAYRSLPNAVAAASITDGAGGGPTLFDDVAMLYYAPLKTDAIRLTYNTIRFGSGTAWIAIC
ncbi:LtfC-like domain-containing protein, partial [Mycobacteroides abscessus]